MIHILIEMLYMVRWYCLQHISVNILTPFIFPAALSVIFICCRPNNSQFLCGLSIETEYILIWGLTSFWALELVTKCSWFFVSVTHSSADAILIWSATNWLQCESLLSWPYKEYLTHKLPSAHRHALLHYTSSDVAQCTESDFTQFSPEQGFLTSQQHKCQRAQRGLYKTTFFVYFTCISLVCILCLMIL